MTRQFMILVAAFAGGATLAVTFGAANFGTALGIGQLCFAGTLVWVLLRKDEKGR